MSCHKKVHTLSKHNVTQNTASLPTECNDFLNIWQNMLHAGTGVTVVVRTIGCSCLMLYIYQHRFQQSKFTTDRPCSERPKVTHPRWVWRYQRGIRNLYWRRTDNTLAKRKSAKGQTTPTDDSFIHPRSLQDRFLSATNSSNVVQGRPLSRGTNRRRLHNANL